MPLFNRPYIHFNDFFYRVCFRENTLKYYNDLAEEAERRRIHAEWRIRRMKLFDERVTAIASSRREFINTPDELESPIKFPEVILDPIELELEQEPIAEISSKTQDHDNSVKEAPSEAVVSEDENSNPKPAEEKPVPTVEVKPVDTLDDQNKNVSLPIKRAVRPTILDLANDNDRLDGLLSLRETDNMTAAQRNKLKVLQHEYGITPNNNESSTILLAMEKTLPTQFQENRKRNTQHVAWDAEEITKPTTSDEQSEMQTNRLKNTQHLDWEDSEVASVSPIHTLSDMEINRNKVMSHFYNKPEDTQEKNTQMATDMEINRNKNMSHFYNKPEDPQEKITQTLSDMEINRNKIMSHTYNRPEESHESIQTKSDKLTDCQINRNKSMAHHPELFTFLEPESHFKETPMSTNTDQFTVSSSIPAPSFGDTPFSEITNNSDMMFARSSDNISSDGASTHGRGVKYFQDTPAFPNFIGFGSLPNTPSTESQQLTVADVEMIDATSLQVFLKKSVVVPLTVQSYLVNNALIKVRNCYLF